ncbi:transglutaminase domain-containing protein [Chitinophaga nivalis]|uniref:Transglutaminase-like domain-containing protein n=1 Tax=Chitinophaga nivalis TaxID=2991709 RepID=A0ABT3IFD4_9BACT|nr:transglutaminase domain-containing protein [Chitinophaga nivalis]MCW3467824.1 hypothetical protein [Chitinophaga nivalis]MCW3482484.1 hypothetical protein [Chitinophaga nivalis]
MRFLYHSALLIVFFITAFSSNSSSQTSPGKRIATTTSGNSYAAIDKKALEIPDTSTSSTTSIAAYINTNFTTDIDKARAAFIWVASNISYDLDNMFALNFYEKKEEKMAKALKTQKGICENYALLFTDICTKAGIKTFVVEGFTKQNGFTDYIPHAWCAARIDTSWYLFDPTWGSGYVMNRKFVKKIDNSFFKTAPAKLIKSHMPFDYLWQLLNYPITSTAFYEGKTGENHTKPYFNYNDSIIAYEKMDEMIYYAAAVTRMEQNGLRNAMQFDRLHHLKQAIEIDKQNKIANQYNAAVHSFNLAINYFNDFVNYRNQQFKPEQSDANIQAMLDAPAKKIKATNGFLDQIVAPDANTANLIATLRKEIVSLTDRIDEQQVWLKAYLQKGKAGRKSMFTKYTWFGVPLN